MPTARVQEADCSRFVPRLALVFPLRAFFGLYSSCSFLFISIYYLLSSSSCSIFIHFGSSFLFSFVFSSLLGSRSARLCALFCVRRPFGLLFFLDSSRIPPQTLKSTIGPFCLLQLTRVLSCQINSTQRTPPISTPFRKRKLRTG